MDAIKQQVVIGESTETLLKLAFDNRIAQESGEGALNAMSRAIQIRDLKTQVLSFIKRNSNSKFKIEIPEYGVDKVLTMSFTNFIEEDIEEVSKFDMAIDDNFTKCRIAQKADLGRDIELILTSEK